MKIFAAAGLFTIIASWCLLLGSILVSNISSRRRARDPGAVRHDISWIEFIPFLVLAIVITAAMNRWHAELGFVVVGALHGALIIAWWSRTRGVKIGSSSPQ